MAARLSRQYGWALLTKFLEDLIGILMETANASLPKTTQHRVKRKEKKHWKLAQRFPRRFESLATELLCDNEDF